MAEAAVQEREGEKVTDNLLTIQQVADMAGVSTSAVNLWIKDGKIPSLHNDNGRTFVPKEDAETYISNRVPPKGGKKQGQKVSAKPKVTSKSSERQILQAMSRIERDMSIIRVNLPKVRGEVKRELLQKLR